MTGNVWYQLGPRIGMWKVGGNGGHMGWLGVWVEVVDEVDNGTSAGSTCIGKGDHAIDAGVGRMGAGAGTGAAGGGAGAGVGAGAVGGGTGGGWEKKNEGPG
jgi:hypothetical protein